MTRSIAIVALAGLVVLTACSSNADETSSPTSDGAAATTTTDTTAPPGPAPSAGCGATPAAAPGTSDETITFDGADRHYQLIVPDGYDGTTPLPLVFGLHALTVSYTMVAGGAGFADAADGYDFITVMPSGMIDAGTPFWVASEYPDNPDLPFIADLLDKVEADLCIDTTKVFSTGQSNGAQMSSLLACEMSDRITAVAPLDGVEFPDDCPGTPVPVMAFHGDADPIVTYEGGGLNARTIANQHYWKGDIPAGVPIHHGVDSAMRNWAAHNGCEPGRHKERISPEVLRFTWDGCEADTVLYVIEGGGHTWPGRPFPGFEATFGHTTTDIDATALMFDFFLGPPDN